MITKIFDNGWNGAFVTKQFESFLINRMLEHLTRHQSRTVVINSVWYTDVYHRLIIRWLSNNDWDQIVLVSMLDPAIPGPSQFSQFQKPVHSVGYYPGPYHLDFWALFSKNYMEIPNIEPLMQLDKIEKSFMCLNRKPHLHRVQLYKDLQKQGLIDKGIVSLGGSENGPAVKSLNDANGLPDNLSPNGSCKNHGIPNDIATLGNQDNWDKHFLNVVTETCFDINSTGFVSEKIYKPIRGCRPFLVYASDGGIKWLHEKGFENYVLEFKDISDLDLSMPENIPKFLKILCDQPVSYLRKKFSNLHEKILYNRDRFENYIQEQQQVIELGINHLV